MILRWGRKKAMLTSGPLLLLSWIIALSTRSIGAFYVVRLVQGLALSVPFTITPIYLAEIAEPKVRGQLGGYFQIFWYIGILYSYTTGPYLSYQNYLYLATIPPILFMICYSFAPESPYYLLMTKKEDEALKALTWLRAGEDVTKEFAEMKESVEEDMKNKGSWKDLIATKKDRKALIIVQIVCVVKYMNGMSSIVIYLSQTFAESAEISLTSDEMSIVIAVILIVTTLGASFVADSVGRRLLLIISTIGSTIFHTIVAIYYYLDKYTDIDVSSYMWISFVSIIGFCVITNVGLGPLMLTIQAEYFPSHTRGKGGGVTGVVAALASFLSIKQYQLVEDTFGMYMNYVIFAVISLIGLILIWCVIHETAGKTLGQIQKSMENTSERNKA